MNCRALALLLASVPVVALAQPAPAESDFSKGVAARIAGHPAEAIPLLEQAVKTGANDPDRWLNLGIAYSEARRYADAEHALDEAARLSPEYVDVQIARARLAFFRADLPTAHARLDPVLLRKPQNAEAQLLQRQLQAAERAEAPWRIDTALAYADYSKGLPAGREQSVALSRHFAGGVFASAMVDHVTQLGATDTYYEGEAGNRYVSLAIGGAPDGAFRPQRLARLSLFSAGYALSPTWSAQLFATATLADYRVGEIHALHPGLTLTQGDRFSVTARWYNTWDETHRYRTGYGLRVMGRPSGPLELSAGYADAPETSEGRTETVKSISLGGAVDVTDHFTLRLDGVHESRPTYDRRLVSLGLTQRF